MIRRERRCSGCPCHKVHMSQELDTSGSHSLGDIHCSGRDLGLSVLESTHFARRYTQMICRRPCGSFDVIEEAFSHFKDGIVLEPCGCIEPMMSLYVEACRKSRILLRR